jgi:glycine C-acetyltransferase
MHDAVFQGGVMMVPIIYPSVAAGAERLRLNVTRGHTKEDMDKALELLDRAGRAFNVQSGEPLEGAQAAQ